MLQQPALAGACIAAHLPTLATVMLPTHTHTQTQTHAVSRLPLASFSSYSVWRGGTVVRH